MTTKIEEKKPTQFTAEHFRRRLYTVEGDDLDKAKKIQLVVLVDGKPLVQMEAREPGLLAFVSRPDRQGFDIEAVEVSGPRYTDVRLPEAVGQPLPWQLDALGVK